MKSKKQYGQNFLTSPAARAAIVNAGEILKGENVLEIGPGKGFLTEGLLAAGAHVTGVEMDHDLIDLLEEKFKEGILLKNFNLINQDALKFNTDKIDKYKLIANIPYYITGAIIRKYLSDKNKPDMMVILVQREVAERIVTRDGKESVLSISVKIYSTPSIVHRVSAGSFYPKPKVDSAVLKISNINNDYFDSFADPVVAEQCFFDLLHKAFAHKRKLMINNISQTSLYLPTKEKPLKNTKEYFLKIFKNVGLDEKCRAESVTIEQWRSLYLQIYISTSTLS